MGIIAMVTALIDIGFVGGVSVSPSGRWLRRSLQSLTCWAASCLARAY